MNSYKFTVKKMKYWDVYRWNCPIDRVSFQEDMTAKEVYDSLVNHDGYNPNIKVRRAQ